MKRFAKLRTTKCPFANLPEPRTGRWGAGLTLGEDEQLPMAETRAGRAIRVSRMTPDDHLRHSRFVGLRQDKKPKDVVRESDPEG